MPGGMEYPGSTRRFHGLRKGSRVDPAFEMGLPIEIVAFIAKDIPAGRPEVRHPTARALAILKSSPSGSSSQSADYL